MKDLHGLIVTTGGEMVAPGVRLRWSSERHALAGNNQNSRDKCVGTLWHEDIRTQPCTNPMCAGELCNGHPMTQGAFLRLVHRLSKEEG